MTNVQMNLRIDKDVKRKMDATAAALGTTSAAAMNIFARQFVAVGGFPFDVKIPQSSEVPRIDRGKLYQAERMRDGSPVLPSEWRDQEGDIYDDLA
ncbi:type II toxin-antitoxin system RelB/DinJ family antitoxin [Xiamenia xianingshaonis]|uniref:Type II toxin-antitoxin system RelB/DinJ family antitoxin n=1 Tax=Xiamenia xianingshaonis TaxID=2682776 RepID=A0A9E6MQC9_9ACTN|nr:type II toxin-antitoxin system RelB/DinJ family antitoxin [Xiamenia xianingshaonis]QTU84554.1 type II toxin-antitoxin system RelB/DinJ family antitoxin [Xiamenia xianingshaonis]